MTPKKMKTLLLIDANSIIHRSFHALPPFTGPDGAPTGAIYGIASILLKLCTALELNNDPTMSIHHTSCS